MRLTYSPMKMMGHYTTSHGAVLECQGSHGGWELGCLLGCSQVPHLAHSMPASQVSVYTRATHLSVLWFIALQVFNSPIIGVGTFLLSAVADSTSLARAASGAKQYCSLG
jgi:hypothetical protein